MGRNLSDVVGDLVVSWFGVVVLSSGEVVLSSVEVVVGGVVGVEVGVVVLSSVGEVFSSVVFLSADVLSSLVESVVFPSSVVLEGESVVVGVVEVAGSAVDVGASDVLGSVVEGVEGAAGVSKKSVGNAGLLFWSVGWAASRLANNLLRKSNGELSSWVFAFAFWLSLPLPSLSAAIDEANKRAVAHKYLGNIIKNDGS